MNTDDARGGGRVDMRDFRRWRDWLLQAENAGELELDGEDDHPKKDLNGDDRVGTAAEENLYPRGDFNGDGIISRTARRDLPGSVGEEVTDLEVMMRVFDDEHYDAADLPGLIDSGDLAIDAGGCLTAGIAEALASIGPRGAASPALTRTHLAGSVTHIYTLPMDPAGYTARVEARDETGAVVGSDEADFHIGLGGDYYWRPNCGSLEVELFLPDTVEFSRSADLLAGSAMSSSALRTYASDGPAMFWYLCTEALVRRAGHEDLTEMLLGMLPEQHFGWRNYFMLRGIHAHATSPVIGSVLAKLDMTWDQSPY